MTDNKKKGDFNKGGKDDVGGDKKQRADRNENSRTGSQNSGRDRETGGHDQYSRTSAKPAASSRLRRRAKPPTGGRDHSR